MDVEARGHVFLLGHLEAHDVVARLRRAVDREAGGVRSPVLQRLQHRGHLPADVRAFAAMDESGNSAHAPPYVLVGK